MDDLTARVLDEARRTLGRPLVGAGPDDTLEGLGLDSLDVAETCLELERVLGVDIPDEEVTTTLTVAQLTDRVRRAVGHRERVGRARP